MGLNAAVQALKKAEPLKDKVQRCKDLLNDSDAWVCQQQLQKIYQQVLILDLEYALDRKVEQELWNLGFKNYIATLQSQAKDRKNPKRGESQALLSWCLEAASGFYLTLLQEICTAFDLDLPFRRKGYVYGCTSPWKAVENLSVPHKSSCFYACQYCLVHLGDIARYRNECKQAELFYRHAVSLSPSSGQPYNQLALLEASRGNKLGTVFHYARSVAVKHPFPVATTNLARTLSSALNDTSTNVEGRTKLTCQEYVAVFLKLHGVLHNLGDTRIASGYAKLLTETLTALVATESFSWWMLVQMFAINLYALEHTTTTTSIVVTGSAEPLRNEQLTYDERQARDCVLDLVAGSLSALLLPVYTIKNSIVEYFALPSIKLCLDWIHAKPTVLEEPAFASRLQIWPSLCVLLNALQNSVLDFRYEQYANVPLPEDRDLQGFLPLERSFECLKFTNTDLEGDHETLNKVRAVRILRLGRSLAQHRINGSAVIAVTIGGEKGDGKFSSTGEVNGPSNELMRELEELTTLKQGGGRRRVSALSASPVLSESASSKGSADVDLLSENSFLLLLDKRIGILKPQGSLERNKPDTSTGHPESNSYDGNVVVVTAASASSASVSRKPRQNIAMQAIMRRAETEQKQVTFKNVSPLVIEEEEGEGEGEEHEKKVEVDSPVKSLSAGNKGNGGAINDDNDNNASVGSTATSFTSSVQNRLPLMPFPTTTVQNSIVSPTIPAKPAKSQQKNVVSPHAQINHLAATKEQQQSPGSLAATLPPISCVSQCAGTVCYPTQPFNVQNPQFAKNYLTNQIGNATSSSSSYSMQQGGHYASSPGGQQSMPQNISLQHAASQSRPPPLHQRMLQIHGIPRSSSLMHQNVGHRPSANQPNAMSAVSHNMNSQQAGSVVLQPNLNLQQQQQQPSSSSSHNLDVQQNHSMAAIQQQNLGKSGLRSSTTTISLHDPVGLNSPAAGIVNASSLSSSLNTYQKSVHRVGSIVPSNVPSVPGSSLSPTAATTTTSSFHFHFNQTDPTRNAFGQMSQKQLPSPIYNNNNNNNNNNTTTTTTTTDLMEFSFPNQLGMSRSRESQMTNNYPLFHNYDTGNFSLWKDARQSHVSVPCWGSTTSGDTQLRGNDSTTVENFRNWEDSVDPGNTVSQLPLRTSSYQSDSQHGKRFGGVNNFDHSTTGEVELKSSQSINTGNTYSLFSSNNAWGTGSQACNVTNQDPTKARLGGQQSLWSGPGPSPLERLLEQQKSLREGGT